MAISHIVVLAAALLALLTLPCVVAAVAWAQERRSPENDPVHRHRPWTGLWEAPRIILRETFSHPTEEVVLVRRDRGRGVVRLDQALAEDETDRQAPVDGEVGGRHEPT